MADPALGHWQGSRHSDLLPSSSGDFFAPTEVEEESPGGFAEVWSA